MSSPCKSCIVRPICKYYCKKWFQWSKHLDLESPISLEDFLKVVGNYGPIRNYYQATYDIQTIKFEKVDNDPLNVRVCLGGINE